MFLFYEARCQLWSNLFDLSLDVILGYLIQATTDFRYQSMIVYMSMIGFLNGIISLITFVKKQTRIDGCRFYLLLVTMFFIKYVISGPHTNVLSHESDDFDHTMYFDRVSSSIEIQHASLRICREASKYLNKQ